MSWKIEAASGEFRSNQVIPGNEPDKPGFGVDESLDPFFPSTVAGNRST
jgi:hypothetical protein